MKRALAIVAVVVLACDDRSAPLEPTVDARPPDVRVAARDAPPLARDRGATRPDARPKPCAGTGDFCPPRRIATSERGVTSVAADYAWAVWTTDGDGRLGSGAVRAMQPSAAQPKTLAGKQHAPMGVATDGRQVYWMTVAAAGKHVVRVVARGGGAVTERATWTPELGETRVFGVTNVALGHGSIFFGAGSRVMQHTLGQTLKVFASDPSVNVGAVVAASNRTLYWATLGRSPTHLRDPGRVRQMRVEPRAKLEEVVTSGATGRLSVSATRLFYGGPGRLDSALHPNHAGAHHATVARGAPQAVAVDSTHVYWIDSARKLLLRSKQSGGGAEVLARNLDNAIALAVSTSGIVVGERGAAATGGAKGAITYVQRRR